MDRTSSRGPEELIVPGFRRSANQNLPHHHGNSTLLNMNIGNAAINPRSLVL